MYRKDGGAFPDPILNLTLELHQPDRAGSGRAGQGGQRPRAGRGEGRRRSPVLLRAGQQLAGFAQLRDDGTTACGCWIYTGCWTEAGNMMARRDATDPREQGLAPNWAFSWPANRRILYNRASADPSGKPWNPAKPLIQWNGSAWTGIDVPDYAPTNKPDAGVGPFIMLAGRHGAAVRARPDARGAVPRALRAVREPGAEPAASEGQRPIRWRACSPATRRSSARRTSSPMSATTYRLTEHFHFWTKHAKINAILQPEEFVEIGEALAKEKGIAQGDWVKLSSQPRLRRRPRPMSPSAEADDGATASRCTRSACRSTGASPALARKGFGANVLTPFVGDANVGDAGIQGVPGRTSRRAAGSPVA